MVKNTDYERINKYPSASVLETIIRYIPFALFCAFLLVSPVIPDVKITRPKLLFIETCLYGAFFLWLATNLYFGKLKFRNSFLNIPVLVYTASVAVFYLFSPDKPVALSELKRSLLSAAAYFTASNLIDTPKKRGMALGLFAAGSFFAIIYGILQRFGGFWIVQVPQFDRIASMSGNPIFFAAYLVVAVSVLAGLMFHNKTTAGKSILAITFVGGIFAVYFTQTRAAFIGLAVSAAVFLWLTIRSSAKRKTVFALLIVIAGVFLFLTKNIWQRQQAHTLIWKDTLTMWAANPVFGTGPGTFHLYFPKYASPELKAIWPQERNIVNDAHNEYIQYLSETGVAGFGIFLWLLVSFFRNALSVKSRITERRDIFLFSGLTAGASGLLAMNCFSVDMRFIVSAVYLFAAAGFIDTFGERFYEKRISFWPLRLFGAVCCLAAGIIAFQMVYEPYRAQKNLAATPDFFDTSILEPARTIADLEEIAKKYPGQALVFEKLGWVYSKEKNWPKAIKNYLQASKLDPASAGPLNNLGNIYFLLGDRSGAIDYWNRSLEINPAQVDSRLNLALAYFYSGKLKESADQLREVLKIDPRNEKAIVMLKQMTE